MGTDSYDEMHRFLTGDDCSDHLLSGRLSALDTPEPLRGVAALFEAAAGPAAPLELSRRSQVVAAATAEVLSSQPQLISPPSRRKAMLSKVLTAKFAAAATVAAFGLGTAAAAATGSLPGQTSNANKAATTGLATATASQTSHGKSNGHGQSGQSHGANSGHTTGSSGNTSTGPANQHALFGLCTAYLAAHGTSTSSLPQDNSTAFKALIAAAAQQGGTTSYCQGIVKQHNSTGDSSDATETPESGKPTNPGKPATTPTKPADAGTPPSNAGSPQSQAPVPTPNTGAGTGGTASSGLNSTGSTKAGTASSGASTAGSGNATTHP